MSTQPAPSVMRQRLLLITAPGDDEPIQWVNGRPYLGLDVLHHGHMMSFLVPLEVDPAGPPEDAPA